MSPIILKQFSSMELANRIVLEEERTRALSPSVEMKELLERNLNIQSEILEVQKKSLEKLTYLEEINRPKKTQPYLPGITTIASATSEGDYPSLTNFINDLGRPALNGTLYNFGPGNLFFVLSRNGVDISSNETKLESTMAYGWGGDSGYPISYIHIRVDKANTKFEIVAG